MSVLLVHYKEWEKILVLSYMKTIDSAIFQKGQWTGTDSLSLLVESEAANPNHTQVTSRRQIERKMGFRA